MNAVSFQEATKNLVNPKNFSRFSAYRDAQAQKCVDDLLPRWRNRLGGTETFLPSHCAVMVQALAEDFGPD